MSGCREEQPEELPKYLTETLRETLAFEYKILKWHSALSNVLPRNFFEFPLQKYIIVRYPESCKVFNGQSTVLCYEEAGG